MKNKIQIAGYLLAGLLLFALLNSAYFFLSIVGMSFIEWLAFNACSLSVMAYLVCFACFKVFKKHHFLAVVLLPLYYYGTMGLFVTSWNSSTAFAQITHIIITLNVIWLLVVLLKQSAYEALAKGLLVGLLVFVPVFAFIQNYMQLHGAELSKMLEKLQ